MVSVEMTAAELAGYAFMIVTEPLVGLDPGYGLTTVTPMGTETGLVLLVATKRCEPSVLTMSGSSTPWTCTFVPVNEGVAGVEEVTAAGTGPLLAAPKTAPRLIIMGPPMKNPPPAVS